MEAPSINVDAISIGHPFAMTGPRPTARAGRGCDQNFSEWLQIS
jgi:hypothetical protein